MFLDQELANYVSKMYSNVAHQGQIPKCPKEVVATHLTKRKS